MGYKRVLGPDHASTLKSASGLGRVYRDQDRLMEAKAMHPRALTGSEKAMEPNNTLMLNTVNNLGNVYVGQGKLADAETMY
jgi:hypothetical protein